MNIRGWIVATLVFLPLMAAGLVGMVLATHPQIFFHY